MIKKNRCDVWNRLDKLALIIRLHIFSMTLTVACDFKVRWGKNKSQNKCITVLWICITDFQKTFMIIIGLFLCDLWPHIVSFNRVKLFEHTCRYKHILIAIVSWASLKACLYTRNRPAYLCLEGVSRVLDLNFYWLI